MLSALVWFRVQSAERLVLPRCKRTPRGDPLRGCAPDVERRGTACPCGQSPSLATKAAQWAAAPSRLIRARGACRALAPISVDTARMSIKGKAYVMGAFEH